jgi:hypothetical protein
MSSSMQVNVRIAPDELRAKSCSRATGWRSLVFTLPQRAAVAALGVVPNRAANFVDVPE